MNLFGRLFYILFSAWFSQKIERDALVQNHFRVWLHDLGWRDHLPNYRFFSFMELGRFSFWHGTRLATAGTYKTRMIAAQEFIYLRPIAPFTKFRCDTTLEGWDHKYFYFRHNFYVKDKLVAVGLVKEACLKNNKVVSPLEILGVQEQSTEVIAAWQLLQQKNELPATLEVGVS